MSRKKHTPEATDTDEHFVSKSQLKREMDALQAIGLEVVKLTDAQVAQVPMDPQLAEAIALARRIRKKHEAFRRQMQFIGKLMRQRDTQPIEDALQKLKYPHQQATLEFHQVEQWRDRLLGAEADEALQELLAFRDTIDADKIRQWQQEHRIQQQQSKPPMASRQLFVYLREQLC